MAETQTLKVIADHENGLVVLSFDKPTSSYAAGPDEMSELAQRLWAAAETVEMGSDSQEVGLDWDSTDFADLDEEGEEPVGEIVQRLKHEEKEAHGGD